MKATELIGKVAIRKEPTKQFNDHSYMNEPLRIIHATEFHVVAAFIRPQPITGKRITILRKEWVDGWEDFQPYQDKIDEYYKTLNVEVGK